MQNKKQGEPKKRTMLKTKEQLYAQFTRQELKDYIQKKDAIQTRPETAEELGVSVYTLRLAAKEVGLDHGKGRPVKDTSKCFKEE